MLQHRGHRRQFVCPTPRRDGLEFGRQNNFVPSRRFREDSREHSKLAKAERRQNIYSSRVRRGETNEAYEWINRDPLQVKAEEPAVTIFPEESRIIQILEATRPMLRRE